MHHLHMTRPLLDHLFILYLLIILVDIITYFDVLFLGLDVLPDHILYCTFLE